MRRTFIAALIATAALRCATASQSAPPAAVASRIASDADVEAALPRLSNWGRWGAADRLGTLNFITPAAVRDAHRLVTEGRTVSLARAVRLAGNEGIRRAQYEMMQDEFGSRDFLAGVWHGFAQTHLDALCHAFANPKEMYNGVPTSAVTPEGCRELDITAIAAKGVVGRGVLLDVGAAHGAAHGGALEPGTAITIAQLEDAARRQRVTLRSGDILLVRTGAGTRNTRDRRAGLHPECLLWVKERQVALLVSDGDSDVAPLAGLDKYSSPFHSVGIPYLGLPLVDNADLDELARTCSTLGRWEFLLVIAPWRMTGATSSPVNPIAVF